MEVLTMVKPNLLTVTSKRARTFRPKILVAEDSLEPSRKGLSKLSL